MILRFSPEISTAFHSHSELCTCHPCISLLPGRRASQGGALQVTWPKLELKTVKFFSADQLVKSLGTSWDVAHHVGSELLVGKEGEGKGRTDRICQESRFCLRLGAKCCSVVAHFVGGRKAMLRPRLLGTSWVFVARLAFSTSITSSTSIHKVFHP